jgi:hypothetical protein
MPVGRFRYKKSGSQIRGPGPRTASRPRSLAELLGRNGLAKSRPESAQPIDWIKFTRNHLPPELAPRVTGAELSRQVLCVRVDSAAWAARLRFALGEAAPEMRREMPQVTRVEVRVTPAGARRNGGA